VDQVPTEGTRIGGWSEGGHAIGCRVDPRHHRRQNRGVSSTSSV
jgi:hypothetical protein